ncbi:ASCH domain-containing protein [Elizabethkingia anophelis]|nr:ASCH domain-containing protein [Elizabethkingia anophelis]MCT3682066.1 ASCH domain-containing protein [Elizabethkingia anophelis]
MANKTKEAKNELYLVLTKEWFDKILSGEKKEEYRAMTNFYISRLGVIDEEGDLVDTKQYDTVRFQLGYGKEAPQMVVECKDVLIEHDKDIEDTLTEENSNFVIVLGKIVDKINIK